jgi:hypothetical protein
MHPFHPSNSHPSIKYHHHPCMHSPSVSLIADPGGRGERRESTSRRLARTYNNTRNPKGKAPPLTSNSLSLPPLPPAKPGAVSAGAHLKPIHPSILPTHQRREDDIHPSSSLRPFRSGNLRLETKLCEEPPSRCGSFCIDREAKGEF